MEYGNRKTLQSNPAPEPTAFTMRSIHDILAETGDEGLLQPPTPQPAKAPPVKAQPVQAPPVAAASAVIKQPPSAQVIAKRMQKVLPEIEPVQEALRAAVPEKKLLPFGKRLASRIFGRN